MLSQETLKDAAKLARTERVYEKFSITESFRYDELDKYDLFISHSFSDKDLVIGLRECLATLQKRNLVVY